MSTPLKQITSKTMVACGVTADLTVDGGMTVGRVCALPTKS